MKAGVFALGHGPKPGDGRSRRKLDLAGQRFGFLVALSGVGTRRGARIWLCACDCGGQTEAVSSSLVSGTHISCGCHKGRRRGRSDDELAWTAAFNAVKNSPNARARGFTLTPEEFRAMASQDCIYCGEPPRLYVTGGTALGTTAKRRSVVRNGLDRRDPSMGYTPQNAVPCCGQCNTAKLDYTLEEFIAWVDRVHAKLHARRE